MKLLKSGIELDPRDLNKIRGSACACGCGIDYNSMWTSGSGVDSEACQCGCEDELGNPERFEMGMSASRYLQLP